MRDEMSATWGTFLARVRARPRNGIRKLLGILGQPHGSFDALAQHVQLVQQGLVVLQFGHIGNGTSHRAMLPDAGHHVPDAFVDLRHDQRHLARLRLGQVLGQVLLDHGQPHVGNQGRRAWNLMLFQQRVDRRELAVAERRQQRHELLQCAQRIPLLPSRE